MRQSTEEHLNQGSHFRSVADLWHHRVESTPDSDAMIHKVDGAWTSLTWREAGQRVRALTNGLLAHGITSEQRVCIIGATRVDWVLADFAIQCAGAATTTIYPSSTPDEVAFVIADCDAVAVFVDTAAQAERIVALRARVSSVKLVIAFDAVPEDAFVISLATLAAKGATWAAAHPDDYDVARAGISPSRLSTLIYTSGTTGRPKGVMLTHDAWMYEAEAIDALQLLTPADKQFLFLPLAHVFAKVLEVLFVRLGIPTVIAGDVESLMQNLQETQPTFMAAVPRVFEKAYNRIVTGARESGGMTYRTFQWAVDVGAQVSLERQAGRAPGAMLRAKAAVADRLVFSQVRQRFGGRIRFCISGAAPLSKEVGQFFDTCGLLVLEGYGLTESSAATCLNRPPDVVFGTVGRPIPGTQLRVAQDGEVLIKGRGVMTGYYKLPDLSAEALTPDGWLRTGDVGVLLDSGHLKLTDRKKEIIVTSGGKNVAPAHFEGLLRGQCAYVSHVVVHGDRRPYVTALVAINEEVTGRWARDRGLPFADYADLAGRPEVRALVQDVVDTINKQLPSFETVKALAFLPEDLTVENGLLTASHKVKRRAVEEKYSSILDALYK